MTRTRPHTTAAPIGSVHSDELLPVRVFCQRLGMGRKAWAALAKRGFPVIRCGKQGLVYGAAALAFFRELCGHQSGSQKEDAATCDSMVCVQQLRTGESITVLITLRRDEMPSRRSVMSTLENTNIFLGKTKVQINQINGNEGNVNNAVVENGAVIQTTGAGNKVHVQTPKDNRCGALWKMVKALWNWGVRIARRR